jgi:hypothetical protein
MRLYGIGRADVEAVIASPGERNIDDRVNERAGKVADGRPILVVVARDDPAFVITVFVRSW